VNPPILPPAISVPLRAVLLDTGPLGLAANPTTSFDGNACSQWIEDVLTRGLEVFVPEIADYELRRELIQARLTKSVAALDDLIDGLSYLVLITPIMRHATRLWAEVRQAGQPTADRPALDGDVILAAQALSLGYAPGEVVIATTNVGHLSRLMTARYWQEI
jgi:predicted nucleic acid-binding protein